MSNKKQWKPPASIQSSITAFGARLRHLREKRGWDQEFLAEKIGCSESYISLLETGVRVPSYVTQAALAKAFNMKIARLMEAA